MNKKVFVSGCYDMLHSGHVAFFEEAASYGDLYVGLGSDRTIQELKGRKTVNDERERLYMVKAVRYVKDAWINSGSGIMDFEKEVRELKPDIFFVNSDGYTPGKEAFCKELGIKLVVSKRIPGEGMPARSTTAAPRPPEETSRMSKPSKSSERLPAPAYVPAAAIKMFSLPHSRRSSSAAANVAFAVAGVRPLAVSSPVGDM